MYDFNNILVALDQSDLDKQLTKTASFLSEISTSKNVYFVNIVRDLNLPDSIKKEFPDMVKNALSDRKKEIEAVVKKYFQYSDANIYIDIRSGIPIKAILKYSAEKDIDLILAGRKNDQNGGGMLVNRLARRAECSLLIIPWKFKMQVNKILVPIDYSEYSKNALKQAINLAEKNLPDMQVLVQNVFQVPNGYRYTGKTYDEFARIMEENSEKDYKAFMYAVDTKKLDVTPEFTLDKKEDTIAEIYSAALKLNADAIVIGAKGRTATAALFIGSRAEKLVQIAKKVPLMIVRRKGEKQKGIIDVLKKI